MDVAWPLTLDEEVWIRDEATNALRGPFRKLVESDLEAPGTLVSEGGGLKAACGLDRRERKHTNLVGIRGRRFLKRCGNAQCGDVLVASAFGAQGRVMANGERRDQADCPACRQGRSSG